jgi:hypothetical protein
MDNCHYLRLINLFPKLRKKDKLRLLSLIASNAKVERALKTIFREMSKSKEKTV